MTDIIKRLERHTDGYSRYDRDDNDSIAVMIDAATAIKELEEENARLTSEPEIRGAIDRKHPDKYVITGVVAAGESKGQRVFIYFSKEGGGWWQWGCEGWAERFDAPSGRRYDDALLCAKKCGPWYNCVDPRTIKTIAVPAVVRVY